MKTNKNSQSQILKLLTSGVSLFATLIFWTGCSGSKFDQSIIAGNTELGSTIGSNPSPTPSTTPTPIGGSTPPAVSSVASADVFAKIDANLPFSQEIGGWGVEADAKNGSVAGLSDVTGFLGSDLGGSFGAMRFGKTQAPDNPAKKVLVVRGNINDGLTASAPRTEVSIWRTQPGRIPIKQDFWYAFGMYLPSWTRVPEDFVISQWHTIGGAAGYGGQPFMGIYLRNDTITVQARYNNNTSISAATSVGTVFTTTGAPVNQWHYFIFKGRISPKASDGPYLKVWRSIDGAAPVQFVNYTGPLGYTGFDTDDPPWQKFGHYPWGYNTSNPWSPAVPTKTIYYRTPVYVRDTTNKYTPQDLLLYVKDR